MIGCSKRESEELSGSGILEATEILISAKSAGTLIEMPVAEGIVVSAGQMIAQIDTEKIYLQKKQLIAAWTELKLNLQNAQRGVDLARENLENIKKKYQRIKALLEENSATQQQYDDIFTAYQAAQVQYDNAMTSLKALRAKEDQLVAQLELIESQLRDTKITAPITGTIIEKYVEQGEIARVGGPIVSMADLQKMWIKVFFKEPALGRIKLNSPAEIRISAYPDRSFPGRVSWISPRAEFTPKTVQTKEARSDLVYAVKIEVLNPDGVLKIGMPADVVIK
ncbi:MAG: efflux RND transporter periplasmic adaptor subunit [candidate division KSB1 bacterium]|nr:efflux RND transporter periplasmic adaptor subunit [candidate division KSB1 bacterium]MDZ7335503.1 efflux RND transporter periplasmic adaptor subunit [candidate division KSB1 bacterium]MDZ7357117.1 efflux RND transporter periplasmic adaptor subunit [candidate division KSB1 bacterium]MDZ7376234.1 efflux RND transporter periplasmic adaptor subunit [candidate division KSB1 bacterium]MDZ7401760.1 efflux RND transporter periplasmic adaptor subunit [candidate division KSB1 bacterium]